MQGIIIFTGWCAAHCEISTSLAIQALRQTGSLVAPRAGESLAGKLELPQVLNMADWLGFDAGGYAGSTDAGRKLHKLVRQVLDDNPDAPVAQLRVWYRYAGERAAPEPYSQDFIRLRHTLHQHLVSRNAKVKEEDLTPQICELIILEASVSYYERHGHGIIPRQIKGGLIWSAAA